MKWKRERESWEIGEWGGLFQTIGSRKVHSHSIKEQNASSYYTDARMVQIRHFKCFSIAHSRIQRVPQFHFLRFSFSPSFLSKVFYLLFPLLLHFILFVRPFLNTHPTTQRRTWMFNLPRIKSCFDQSSPSLSLSLSLSPSFSLPSTSLYSWPITVFYPLSSLSVSQKIFFLSLPFPPKSEFVYQTNAGWVELLFLLLLSRLQPNL